MKCLGKKSGRRKVSEKKGYHFSELGLTEKKKTQAAEEAEAAAAAADTSALISCSYSFFTFRFDSFVSFLPD